MMNSMVNSSVNREAATTECSPTFVLVTAAYNEEKFIAKTIESVIAQTKRPLRWVIASDGSTDHTDEVVREYEQKFDFIQLLRLEPNGEKGVVSKVKALHAAYAQLQNLAFPFIGNLDADVSFSSTYFEAVLARFAQDPKLGIAGGIILDSHNGHFTRRISNSLRSVAHAIQLVRRECYEEIGGYFALKYGGEDWYAEISARMRGWTVQAFDDLEVLHCRPTGGADGFLRYRIREGKMDFSFGSDFTFEVLKCLRRVPENPILVGAIARLFGFGWAYLSREERLVPAPAMAFLRREQRRRIRSLIAAPGGILRRFQSKSVVPAGGAVNKKPIEE